MGYSFFFLFSLGWGIWMIHTAILVFPNRKLTPWQLLQNTKSIDNQMRHLTYLIENAILNLPEGQEQMAWLIDFTGLSINNTPPIKSARDTVNILQNHYPERLAVAFLYNPPRIFEAFWKVCILTPFNCFVFLMSF